GAEQGRESVINRGGGAEPKKRVKPPRSWRAPSLRASANRPRWRVSSKSARRATTLWLGAIPATPTNIPASSGCIPPRRALGAKRRTAARNAISHLLLGFGDWLRA